MKRIVSILLIILMLMAECQFASAESGSDFVYELNDAGEAVITGYTGSDMLLIIPEEIDGHTVTGIADLAFQGNDKLFNVN